MCRSWDRNKPVSAICPTSHFPVSEGWKCSIERPLRCFAAASLRFKHMHTFVCVYMCVCVCVCVCACTNNACTVISHLHSILSCSFLGLELFLNLVIGVFVLGRHSTLPHNTIYRLQSANSSGGKDLLPNGTWGRHVETRTPYKSITQTYSVVVYGLGNHDDRTGNAPGLADGSSSLDFLSCLTTN